MRMILTMLLKYKKKNIHRNWARSLNSVGNVVLCELPSKRKFVTYYGGQIVNVLDNCVKIDFLLKYTKFDNWFVRSDTVDVMEVPLTFVRIRLKPSGSLLQPLRRERIVF